LPDWAAARTAKKRAGEQGRDGPPVPRSSTGTRDVRQLGQPTRVPVSRARLIISLAMVGLVANKVPGGTPAAAYRPESDVHDKRYKLAKQD
jgi:hypothetical protein